MFPRLMIRCDLCSFFVPVASKPNVSSVPGSPLSCTVTVNVQHVQHSPEKGRITILDRRGLEATVCECYRVVKDEYSRLLG